MKQTILLILILLVMLTTTAQEALKVTPKHKWDIAGQISSPEEFTASYTRMSLLNEKDNSAFSMGLFGNYHLNNNLFIRLRAAICNRIVNYYDENSDSTLGPIYMRNSSIRQNSKTLAFGFGKSVVEQKSIRVYIGLEIATTFFDKCYNIYNNRQTDLGGISFVETVTYTISGGYAVRVGPFVGCQLFFLKNFSVGIEISYAFQYLNIGGLVTQHDVAINTGSNSYFNNYDTTLYFMDTSVETGFSKIKTAFHIEYSF